MKTEDYESMKRWFTKVDGSKRYEPSTDKKYIKYMNLFCNLLKIIPDKLADVTSEEALKIQVTLATVMKDKLNLRELSVTQRINALHSFWRYNGVELTEEIMTYSGTPWMMRERAKR